MVFSSVEEYLRNTVFVAMLAVVILPGCTTGNRVTEPDLKPGRDYAFTSPASGQILKIGQTVNIQWTCSECEGRDFTVAGFTEKASFDLSPRTFNHSYAWVVGTTNASVALLPGTYTLRLTACLVHAGSCYWYSEVQGPSLSIEN